MLTFALSVSVQPAFVLLACVKVAFALSVSVRPAFALLAFVQPAFARSAFVRQASVLRVFAMLVFEHSELLFVVQQAYQLVLQEPEYFHLFVPTVF